MRGSNFLLFSETWLGNDENVDIPNFDCVVKFQGTSVTAGGVAIYQNSNNSLVCTSNMNMTHINLRQTTTVSVNSGLSVAEICAAQCILDNGNMIVMIAIYIYISPNAIHLRIFTFVL